MQRYSTAAALIASVLLGVSSADAAVGPPLRAPPSAPGYILVDAVADAAPQPIAVVDFGAKCDGQSDDTGGFQAAFAAAARSAAGSAVALPAGTCLVSTAVPVPSNTTVTGTPGLTTLRPTDANTGDPVLLKAVGVSNVTVRGITFEDPFPPDERGSVNLITVFKASSVLFDQVVVQHSRGIGIIFSTAVSNSGVSNSIFQDVGNGWRVTGLDSDRKPGLSFCCGDALKNYGNFALSNDFSDTGLDAVSATDQTGLTIRQNRFHAVGGRYAHGGAAIYVAGSQQTTVSANEIYGTFGGGIDLFRVGGFAVSGNRVEQAGSAGIVVSLATDGAVEQNIVLNSNQGDMSSLKGGLAIGGSRGDPPTVRVSFSGNLSTDTQPVKTQPYGFQILNGASVRDITFDASNSVSGNAVAALGDQAAAVVGGAAR